MSNRKAQYRPCPECGEVYLYRRPSGRYFAVCEHCRQKDCVICGKKVPLERGHKNTCSTDCETLKKKVVQNAFYAKRIATDPEHNKRNHARRKAALQQDEAAYAAHLERERARHRLRMNNPEYRAQRQQWHTEHYAQNKEAIQESRKTAWAQLSEAEKEQRRMAARASSRLARRKAMQHLQQSPEALAEHQNYMRAYRAERRRLQALDELKTHLEKLRGKK